MSNFLRRLWLWALPCLPSDVVYDAKGRCFCCRHNRYVEPGHAWFLTACRREDVVRDGRGRRYCLRCRRFVGLDHP